ncbi:unnamed protein product, partial [Prorocentrum cordatum]
GGRVRSKIRSYPVAIGHCRLLSPSTPSFPSFWFLSSLAAAHSGSTIRGAPTFSISTGLYLCTLGHVSVDPVSFHSLLTLYTSAPAAMTIEARWRPMRAGALGLVALAAGAQAVLRGGRTERVEAGGARQGLKAVAGDGRLARSLEGRAQEGRAQEGRSQEGRAQEGRAQASVGWKAVRGKRWSNRWSHALDEIYSDGQGQRQTMKNVMDTKYLSSFRLGGQNMTCILDTGSSDFSVFSSTCTTCGQGALYDSTKSPWYQQGQASSIERFGSGVLETTAAIDQLEIGPYRLNQSFWHVHRASMPVLRASDFQAIMGVGPPEVPRLLAWRDANRSAQLFATSLGAEGEVNQTLRDRAWSLAEKAQWLSDHPAVLEGTRERMFSICLQKEPLSPGYVVWNDTSVAQHPELFHRVPVGRPHEWSVDLRNVRFGFLEAPARDEDAAAPADAGMFQAVEQQEDEEHEAFNASAFDNVGCRDGCRALLDSGATHLSMPAGVVDKLTEEVFHKGRNCSARAWRCCAPGRAVGRGLPSRRIREARRSS